MRVPGSVSGPLGVGVEPLGESPVDAVVPWSHVQMWRAELLQQLWTNEVKPRSVDDFKRRTRQLPAALWALMACQLVCVVVRGLRAKHDSCPWSAGAL
jgi:hypothetical protein